MAIDVPEALRNAINSNEQNLKGIAVAQVDVVVERKVSDTFRIESQARWRRMGEHDRVDVVFTDIEKPEFTPERHVVWDYDSFSQRLRYFDANISVSGGGSALENGNAAFESNFEYSPYYLSSTGMDFAVASESSPHHVGLALLLAPVHNYGLRELFEKAKTTSVDQIDASGVTATVVPEDRFTKFRMHFRSDAAFLVDKVQAWADDSETGDGVPHIVIEFINIKGVFLPKKLTRSQNGVEIERVTASAEINLGPVERFAMVDFPEDCRVDDQVNGKFHVWGTSKPLASFDTYNEMSWWNFHKKEKELDDKKSSSQAQ